MTTPPSTISFNKKLFNIVIALLKSAAIAYIIIIAIIFFFQDYLILFPSSENPTEVINNLKDLKKQTHSENVKIFWDGDSYVLEPETIKNTVVFLHGNTGTAGDRLFIGLNIARPTNSRVVMHEYPSYGGRSGKRDLNAAILSSENKIKQLHQQYGPLVIIGESVGSGIAAKVVGRNPAVAKGLILATPFSSIGSLGQKKFPIFPIKFLLKENLDSIQNLSGFKNKIFVLQAENDELVPAEESNKFKQISARIITLPDTKHNTWPAGTNPVFWIFTIYDVITKQEDMPKPQK